MTKEYDPAQAPFSWDKLDGLLAYKTSLTTCSDILECPASTIQNHIRFRHDCTFTEYAERKLSRTKVKLAQKAIEMALNGDRVMLIFSLKNINGWSDRSEIEIANADVKILIDKVDEQL